MVTKTELHRMVDELRDGEVETAAWFLARLREDPVMAAMEAVSEDDEPLTDDDVKAIDRARADYAAGRHYSLEEIKRDLLGDGPPCWNLALH